MKLVEEGYEKKKDKSKTTTTIVLVFIFIITIIIIGIVIAMAQIKNDVLKLTIDDVYNKDAMSELLFENGKTYVKIRGIADYLGYESYNGEYNNKSENPSKCYIQCENEIVNFELNSKKIYKLNLEENSNYEYYYIDEPVIARGGALYTTIEGLQTAFNVSYIYDKAEKIIKIYTMPYLIQLYSSVVLDEGYTEMSEEFDDNKAILQSMLIVKKFKYGVINVQTGETVIEPKYDKIRYMPTIGEFLVESNKKVGVISKDKTMKVQLLYDSIELIDCDTGLYAVKKDEKYGVIDLKGNVKIYMEYDKIGIDATQFTQNNIKNGYLLVDNLIPVCKDNLWGMYDKTGQLVVDLEYTNFGYIATTNKEALNLLVIPNYDVIVAEKNKKYLLLNSYGKKVLEVLVDDIYMTIESGEYKYYILANDRKRDAEKYLDSQGIVAKDQSGQILNGDSIPKTNKESNGTNETKSTNTVNATENETSSNKTNTQSNEKNKETEESQQSGQE